jgi:hypothetical protein
MFRVAERGSWTDKLTFADVAATVGWEDAVPLLEQMLEDPNEALRIDAAEALTKLTGEAVEARRSEASFPARREVAGLLTGPVASWTSLEVGSGDFLAGADGAPRLCLCAGAELRLFGRDADPVRTLAVPEPEPGTAVYPAAALGLGAGRIVLPCAPRIPGADFLMAVDGEGQLAWRHESRWSRVQGLTLLHTEAGVQGVVADLGSQELVALDPGGEVLWRREGFLPAYRLLSHPALPGVLYVVFGHVDRFAVSRTGCEPVARGIRAGGTYLSEAELFPDEGGRPALVGAGSDDDSVPTLVRVDEAGELQWSATLPGRVGGLAMLEAPDAPRLFVVTVDTGALLVVDEHGTLLHEEALPGEQVDGSSPTYHLAAGQIAPGEWRVFVRLLGRSCLYRIDPSGL